MNVPLNAGIPVAEDYLYDHPRNVTTDKEVMKSVIRSKVYSKKSLSSKITHTKIETNLY